MADDAVTTYPELQIINSLIQQIEALIAESDVTPLRIEPPDPPRRAVYRVIGNSISLSTRKAHSCEAVRLDGSKLVLRCPKTELVRQMNLEVTVFAEKTGRGESYAGIVGKVTGLRRIRGGYDIDVDIIEKRMQQVAAVQRLREFISKNDAQGWNRWCQEISGSLELKGMDLHQADLSGYDLCCADLAGSDLSDANLAGAILAGADLSECDINGAMVAGADFFRAKLNRSQAWVLPVSGMPEVESVLFDS